MIYSQNIFNFTAQLASYFTRDGLFDTSMSLKLMANTFCSGSDKSSVFTDTVHAFGIIRFFLHASSFANSCMVSTNTAVCTLCVRSFVPYH